MGLRIYYDGLNLALQQGTGIATYTRMLMTYARDSGHRVGAVYAVPTPCRRTRRYVRYPSMILATPPAVRNGSGTGLMPKINFALYSLTLNLFVLKRPVS